MPLALLLACGVLLSGLAAALWILMRARGPLDREVEGLVSSDRMRSRWRRWHDLSFVLYGVVLVVLAGAILAVAWWWPARGLFLPFLIGSVGLILPAGVWSWLGRARDELRYRSSRPRRSGRG